LFQEVAGFLAIGTRNADFYAAYGAPEERIFWAPYAVDNDFFMAHASRLAAQKRALREREGISPDLPVILFCGKFLEKKRPFDLLRAFALLEGHPPSSLVLVGDGPLRSEIAAFIARRGLTNVRLLGFRNQRELPACYAMADVLVLPSSFEPWGVVLNEAMCCGLPVIASDRVGAAADLVREGINGFTYPCGNVLHLADRLLRILTDPGARRDMGLESRAIIRGWGIEDAVRGVAECLRRVVGGRAGRCAGSRP
jgi:glycosyltransferase involved in cell wall biosynthesis